MTNTEDDEARRYFEAIVPGGVPWDVKSESLREAWRAQYRNARDFFKGEM